MLNLIKQIIKFGIVGFIAFLIDYGLLYFLTEYLNVYYLTSAAFSFTISLLFNYIASIKFVFQAKKQTYKEIVLFIILSVVGLGINQLLMKFGVEYAHINYLIVKIFATGIVMIYNFITRKMFIEERSNYEKRKVKVK